MSQRRNTRKKPFPTRMPMDHLPSLGHPRDSASLLAQFKTNSWPDGLAIRATRKWDQVKLIMMMSSQMLAK